MKKLKTEYKVLDIYDRKGKQQILLNQDNERKFWHDSKLEKLIQSIDEKGLLQPILVEKTKEKKKTVFRVLGGNRRLVAHLALKKKHIFSKIYENLDEKQRRLIQRAENSTKEKIPSYELANNIWEYWKNKVVDLSKGNVKEYVFKGKSYSTLPLQIRKILPQNEFIKETGLSREVVSKAFLYQNLNHKLKNIIEKGSLKGNGLSYYSGIYLSRIPEKDEQLKVSENLKKNGKYPNSEKIKKAVKHYMHERESEEKDFRLEGRESYKTRPVNLYKNIDRAKKFIDTFYQIAMIEDKILELSGAFKGDKTTKEIINDCGKKADSLETRLKKNEFFRELENKKPKLSLKDKILLGEFQKKGKKGRFLYYNVKEIPIRQIVEDKNQPRKTFEKEKLEELSETYSEIGLLEPVLLKKIDDKKYRLVFGHRRVKAAGIIDKETKKPRLEKIEAMITDAPDNICRELQYEEDIHEKIVLEDMARSLAKLYDIKLEEEKAKGNEYPIYRFASEYKGLGTTTVINHIIFHRLDETTKSLHRAGLLAFSAAHELYKIKNLDERFELAVKSVLLHYSKNAVINEVKRKEAEKNSSELFDTKEIGKEGTRRLLVNELYKNLNAVIEPEKIPAINSFDDNVLVEKYHGFLKSFNNFRKLIKKY